MSQVQKQNNASIKNMSHGQAKKFSCWVFKDFMLSQISKTALHEFNFVFQLDAEPDDPIKFLKTVEEEKKKEKERIARNVSLKHIIVSILSDVETV